MKIYPLAALLISAAVALPAFAGTDGSAQKTRAEVRAELAQARANGELDNPNSPNYPQQFATGGYTVPRAQINTSHLPNFQHDASVTAHSTDN
jgi:Domain of unknown function (DUF4148)